MRKSHFDICVAEANLKALQLLRDVETRWSSTYYMVDRALYLRQVSERCNSAFFTDLLFIIRPSKYFWKALNLQIYGVMSCILQSGMH